MDCTPEDSTGCHGVHEVVAPPGNQLCNLKGKCHRIRFLRAMLTEGSLDNEKIVKLSSYLALDLLTLKKTVTRGFYLCFFHQKTLVF